MSYLSFAIVVLFAFVPPFQFATRAYRGEIALPVIFGIEVPVSVMLILVWLVLWVPAGLVIRLWRWPSVDTWVGRLVESTRPRTVTLFFPLACSVVIFLAIGGINIINLLLDTSFKLEPEVVTLAFFGLVAELGRLVEVAARDERLWIESNVRK